MKTLLTTLFIILTANCWAQRDTTYHYCNGMVTNKENASFYSVKMEDSKKLKDHSCDYDMNGTLYKEFYKTKRKSITKYYHPNGNLKYISEYYKMPEFYHYTKIKTYYENGKIMSKELIENSGRDKKSYTKDGKDTTFIPCFKLPDHPIKFTPKEKLVPKDEILTRDSLIFVEIEVTKEGKIGNIYIPEKYSTEQSNAIYHSLKKYTNNWEPAIFCGEKIDIYVVLCYPQKTSMILNRPPVLDGVVKPMICQVYNLKH